MKRINFEEQRRLQLEILKEVDSFCRANDIRYFLIYGTLLGAIRHKGYIPWDDDLDIAMPYDDMLKFKEIYKSDKFKFIDIESVKNFDHPFARLTYNNTYSLMGLCKKTYGINIDIYPIIGLPENNILDDFVSKCVRLRQIRLILDKINRWATKILPIKSLPFYQSIMKKYRDYLFLYAECISEKVSLCGGSIQKRNIYEKNFFDDVIEVEFEKGLYFSPAKYDEHLRQAYGDYMKLPPENQRRPFHKTKYYWVSDQK